MEHPGRRVLGQPHDAVAEGHADRAVTVDDLAPPDVDGLEPVVPAEPIGADSDGPVEWCKPVLDAEAEALAARFPDLTLRVEPAHREAYVNVGPGGKFDAAQWRLADEALRTWAAKERLDRKKLSLGPEDLGMRITYLWSGTLTKDSAPDCDFAAPFAE